MFNADTRRIARFHDLQRVLHFPRKFVAPLMVFRPGHRPSFDSPDFAPASVQSFRVGLSPSWRPPSPRSPAFTKHDRSRAEINSLGAATIIRSISRDTSAIPGSPSRRSLLSKPVALRSRASPDYSRPTAAGGQDFPDLQADRRVIPVSSYRHREVPRSWALAPDPIYLGPQGFREFLSTSDERTSTVKTGETVPEQGLPLPSQPHLSNENDMNQDRLFSPDRTRSVNEDQSQHVRSPAATLHIDGSVLGRWAVQHLERALGRPATGMSGVDPRATTPRSRIAPF
jgi:hypothetical protein